MRQYFKAMEGTTLSSTLLLNLDVFTLCSTTANFLSCSLFYSHGIFIFICAMIEDVRQFSPTSYFTSISSLFQCRRRSSNIAKVNEDICFGCIHHTADLHLTTHRCVFSDSASAEASVSGFDIAPLLFLQCARYSS